MEKKFKIIDRTVPEIVRKNKEASKDELLQLCRVLKNLGADFIEVDKATVDILQELVEDMKFIYRIREKEDASLMKGHRFSGILVDKIENLKELAAYKLEIKTSQKIILEIHLDSIEELNQWLSESGDIEFNKIYSIRITGLSRSILWGDAVDFNELRETYGVKFDICPGDEYYCASAISLEALEKGADFVTAAFCGNGGREGFAALEEVLMSLKILYKLNMRIEPSFFSLAKVLYEKLTGEVIPGQKPVLGEDIFKCESGIHVDGLIKNPELYEPYDPEIVGLKREIVLGKHSGSAAVMGRLSNLKLDIDFKELDMSSILDALKEKSINIKGQVSDEELKNIIETISEKKRGR